MSRKQKLILLIVTVVMVAGYPLLLRFMFLFMEDSLGLERFDTIASYGQLFVDLTLLPLGILGGLLVYFQLLAEIRTRVKPKIVFDWGYAGVGFDGDWKILYTDRHGFRHSSFHLLVTNNSEVIAVWYQICVHLPRVLTGFEAPGENRFDFRWHRGSENNWASQGNLERLTQEFSSDGQIVLYPKQTVHLASIDFHLAPSERTHETQIICSVATDKSKIETYTLNIKIKPGILGVDQPQALPLEE